MCLLKYGSILATPRAFLSAKWEAMEELFECSLCLGFWAGVLISLFIKCCTPVWDTLWCLFPFYSAVMCWVGDSLIGISKYIEAYLEKKGE